MNAICVVINIIISLLHFNCYVIAKCLFFMGAVIELLYKSKNCKMIVGCYFFAYSMPVSI